MVLIFQVRGQAPVWAQSSCPSDAGVSLLDRGPSPTPWPCSAQALGPAPSGSVVRVLKCTVGQECPSSWLLLPGHLQGRWVRGRGVVLVPLWTVMLSAFGGTGGSRCLPRQLLQHECPRCPELPPFGLFGDLEQHMRKQHELFCCKLCLKHLKVNPTPWHLPGDRAFREHLVEVGGGQAR